MKKFFALLLACAALTLLAPATAHAIDLSSAKQEGLVGEKPDGLVAAVSPNAPAAVQKLIAETNQGRLKVYAETAAKQNIPVSQVQAIAAQKLIERAPSGQYVMVNGQWVQK